MMVEDNQISRRGHSFGKNRQSSLEGGLKVDNVPGPNQWLSHWLIAMTFFQQAVYIHFHFKKRSPGIFSV